MFQQLFVITVRIRFPIHNPQNNRWNVKISGKTLRKNHNYRQRQQLTTRLKLLPVWFGPVFSLRRHWNIYRYTCNVHLHDITQLLVTHRCNSEQAFVANDVPLMLVSSSHRRVVHCYACQCVAAEKESLMTEDWSQVKTYLATPYWEPHAPPSTTDEIPCITSVLLYFRFSKVHTAKNEWEYQYCGLCTRSSWL